jgi:exonuclease VII large subunit
MAKDRQAEGSLAVELPVPFEMATQIVHEVASDGVIRGTAEYQAENELTGAEGAQSSPLLKRETSPTNEVFYKVRARTLAPRHYHDSNDLGTLVVAYSVDKISEEKSTLTIESIFVPDSHHGRSASDGSVETCEFTEIETRLKSLLVAKQQAKEREENEQKQVRIRNLRRQLSEEQVRFDALNAEVEQLQKRSTELRQFTRVRTKSGSVRLQAAPHARSQSVQALTEGEELSVLFKARGWYRVRTSGGQTGWVYASLLETAQ